MKRCNKATLNTWLKLLPVRYRNIVLLHRQAQLSPLSDVGIRCIIAKRFALLSEALESVPIDNEDLISYIELVKSYEQDPRFVGNYEKI